MQILETAMQLEITAEKHYRDLAARTSNVGLANILTRLADAEQKHQRVIAAMQNSNMNAEPGDDTFLSDVKELFRKLEDSKSGVTIDMSQIALYKHARDREVEAEALYKKAAEQEKNPGAVSLLKRLAAQETIHALIIESIIDFLSVAEPGGWLENAEWHHTDVY